jgi:hypothetical protein
MLAAARGLPGCVGMRFRRALVRLLAYVHARRSSEPICAAQACCCSEHEFERGAFSQLQSLEDKQTLR